MFHFNIIAHVKHIHAHTHKHIQINHTIIYVFVYIHKCTCTISCLLARPTCLWRLVIVFFKAFFMVLVLYAPFACHNFVSFWSSTNFDTFCDLFQMLVHVLFVTFLMLVLGTLVVIWDFYISMCLVLVELGK
jgi:hypothetical protein